MIRFIPSLMVAAILLFGWLLPWLFSQKSDQSVVIGTIVIVAVLTYLFSKIESLFKSKKEKGNEN